MADVAIDPVNPSNSLTLDFTSGKMATISVGGLDKPFNRIFAPGFAVK